MVRAKAARGRPAIDEVMGKWRRLSLQEREEVMTFRDKNLVATVAAALHALQANHEMAAAIGLNDGHDPFKSRALVAAFSAKCTGRTCADDPSCTEIKASSLSLRLKPEFLEDEEIFEECKRSLPDFLSPSTKRKQLPLPYWKQLWEATPASLSCLETTFAKTIEQAMWSMASDPRLDAPIVEATDTPERTLDELDESWMEDDDVAGKATKACTKVRKKNQKKSKQAVDSSPSSDSNDFQAPSAGETEADQAIQECRAGSSFLTSSSIETSSTADTGDSFPTSESDDMQSPFPGETESDHAETEQPVFIDPIQRTLDQSFSPVAEEKDFYRADDITACIVDDSMLYNAYKQVLPQSILPPPGLEQLEEHDHDCACFDGPMKVVPAFAAPTLPQKLHCFGGIMCSSGFSKSMALEFDSLDYGGALAFPFDSQQALSFQYLAHLEMPQTLLDQPSLPAVTA